MRVFIVAASPLIRATLENLLGARGFKIMATAANVEALTNQLADAVPDVILVASSGEASGPMLDSLADSNLAEDACMVLLTDTLAPPAPEQAFRAGIRAVLPTDISPDQLTAALHAAASGLLVLHPESISANLRPGGNRGIPTAAFSPVMDNFMEPLTPREREVLQLLATGLGNKEIAVQLAISDHTVKFHVAAILGKLGVSSRTEAVSLAIRRGLVLL